MSLDWRKIKNEYINGRISYRKLAEKHGVSESTLTKKATKEKWADKRKEQRKKIEAKVQQKTAEKIAEQESDLAAEINSAAIELLNKLTIAIQQTDLYIERTKKRLPKKVTNPETGETYVAYQEEEELRTRRLARIDTSSAKQIASALKDLQTIQMAMQGVPTQEAPDINITIMAATPDDIEVDDMEDNEE